METKTDVKIRLEKLNIIDANEKYCKKNGTNVTLKDIATLLQRGCGSGVTWSLAYELASLLDIEPKLMLYALDIVREKYVEITDNEALSAFYESKNRFPPNSFHSNTEKKKRVLELALNKSIE